MTESIPAPIEELKRSSGYLIALGIALSLLGCLAMMAPLVTGISVAILAGVLLLFAGVARILFAFRAQSWGPGLLLFVLGALTIVCGLVMIAHPILGLGFLTLLLAAYFMVDGVFGILYAFQHRPADGWGWMLFSGVAALVLGGMIWSQWPFSGVWAVGLLVGINILFTGSSCLGLGLAGRSARR